MTHPPCPAAVTAADLAKKIVAASNSMKEFFTARKDALLTEVRTKGALDKELEAKLQAACEEWKSSFSA
ncbi:MAG: hypothetical protein WCP53_06705 [Verrucomicrobiota bacterium]